MLKITNQGNVNEKHNKISTYTCYIRIALVKKKHKQKISFGEDVEKLKSLFSVGEIVKWYSQCGKIMEIPQKIELP